MPETTSSSSRALIGNGQTTMLINADGAVDWACLPRFDSPGVFSAILDDEGGGLFAIAPRAPYTSDQRYLDGSNTLCTRFSLSDPMADDAAAGVLELTDAMPHLTSRASFDGLLVRKLRCLQGEVEVSLVFEPRFDTGLSEAWLEDTKTHLRVRGNPAPPGVLRFLQVQCNTAVAWRETRAGRWEASLTLKAGAAAVLVRLQWAETRGGLPHFGITQCKRVTSGEDPPRLEGLPLPEGLRWASEVERSANVLKLLIFEPTGAMVAAPTTSLPEWKGGVRNWDYRYTWVRDGSLAFTALARVGALAEVKAYLGFLGRCFPGGELPLMCTIDGGPVPEERTLDHLSGSYGSTPVRVGNGARDQLQLDIYGPVVEMAFEYVKAGGALEDARWAFLQRVIERVEARWREPDHGIWEPRTGKRHNVHSKLMCWLALDRGGHLARGRGEPLLAARWWATAQDVHADICSQGLDPEGRHFVNAYGEAEPDGALLLMPIIGFLPANDPRIVATVEWLQRALCTGPFIHRYRGRHDDGVGGAEGAFLLCGFWLVEALALMGRRAEALEVFEAHLGCANATGLMAEEVDPDTGEALGNFPQAFSHLGLINAALRLHALT